MGMLDFGKKLVKVSQMTPEERSAKMKKLADRLQLIKPGMTVVPMAGAQVAVPTMKKGGRVKKTGLHLLHKGEMVVPARMVKKMMY